MTDSWIKKFSKEDLMIASCLFLLSLITRIPFASQMIYDSDSARFALAMEHYDVTQMRPHAPGYILYIAMAKLLDFFVHDARASLVGVSILSSALTLVFLYFLACEMYGRSNGLISALALLSSPLFWLNSEMPFTYALEGLFCIVFAYTCYMVITGQQHWLILSAIFLGLATGVRQHIIFLFLPLWLYTLTKCPPKQILISFLVLGLTCMAWFIPMTMLSGGLKKYFSAVHTQFITFAGHPARFLFQIKGRGIIFATFMVYSLGLGIIPIFYYCGRLFRIQSIVRDIKPKFLLLWTAPSVIFFIAVIVYNSGHVVFLLPPLFIILAESAKAIAEDLSDGVKLVLVKSADTFFNFLRLMASYRVILISVVVSLMLINVYVFLFENTQISYATIRERDKHLSELVRLTKENFDPEKSIILTCRLNTQAGFYLPNYLVYCPFPLIFNSSEIPIEAQNVYISFRHQTKPKTYGVATGFEIEPITLPSGINTLILWEKEIAEFYQDSSRPLGVIDSNLNDTKIYFLKVRPEEKIYYDYHYLSVREQD